MPKSERTFHAMLDPGKSAKEVEDQSSDNVVAPGTDVAGSIFE